MKPVAILLLASAAMYGQGNERLRITTRSLPGGTVGALYSAAIAVQGGTPPLRWDVSDGSLPPGLGLGDGTISGIPEVAGTFGFQVRVRDQQDTDRQNFSLAIANAVAQADPLVITMVSLPDGTAGTAYSAGLSATGGVAPLTWTASGLPPGLSLNGSTISGTPTAAGTFTVAVEVRDALGSSARANLPVTINEVPLVVETGSLPGGTVGTAYNATLSATGGTPPYTWSASGLPQGLSVSGSSIIGTPAAAGTSTVTVQVQDSAARMAQRELSLAVVAALAIGTASLPAATAGTAYNANLVASGGTPPYTWSATGLPQGLSVSGAAITGTPVAAGTSTVTVQVQDNGGRTAQRSLSLTVAEPIPPLAVETSSLSGGITGVAYTATLSATGGTPPYTWSATGLPPGLSVSGNTIAGTPEQAGTFNITLRVSDTGGRTAERSVAVTIDYRIEIATQSLPRGAVGVAYQATLSATGGVEPYTWSGSGLPPGLSFGGSGISGTPTATGTFQVQVTARDANNHTATRTLAVEIVAPPSITTESLPAGTTGTSYSVTVAATGGVPPYRWSAQGLPAGLNVAEASGQITGTPTTAGTANVNVRVSDTLGGSASKTLALQIVPPLAVSGDALPGGFTSNAYSTTLRATGGVPPYTWAITSGSLPPGLSLANGGQISGTPTNSGDFPFRARVTDSRGTAVEGNFVIGIAPALAVSEASLPAGAVGTDYSHRLQATGGRAPYTWTVSGGSLPPGLTLDSRTGAISGKPTSPGEHRFTVSVNDAGGQSAVSGFTLTVASTLTIASPSPLPQAAVGVDYSYSFAALAGAPPYTWTAPGQLPAGLSLNRTTGVLSGRPTQSGNFNFAVRVTDAANTAVSKDFALTIAGALSITNEEALPGGSIGAPYSATLTAVAGTSPYTWTVADGSLPPGLTLAAGGAISGTPTQEGNFRFTGRVRDATGATATKALTIGISQELRISTAAGLPSGAVGQAYSQRLQVAGGAAPYRWQVAAGSLPPGLSLNPNTGELGGTPSTAGVYEFTIRVIDDRNATTAQAMQLQITLEGLPVLQMTGLPETAASMEQRAITLRLDRNTNVALTGRLTLSFEPDAVVTADDPSIQFSTGGRTVDFTIPANSSQPNLPPQLALQTGSVAGLITLRATLGTGGSPSPAGAWNIRVARAAPVIRSVRLVRTGAGFEVWVTGLSNTRDLAEASFDFQRGSSPLQTGQARLDYAAPARQWFQDAASRVFGAQFTIIQPFTLNGDQNAVAGVTVTLSNSAGASVPASAQF